MAPLFGGYTLMFFWGFFGQAGFTPTETAGNKKGLHHCNPLIFLLKWLRLLGSNQRPID
jgi:hypothetical protein